MFGHVSLDAFSNANVMTSDCLPDIFHSDQSGVVRLRV